jgi:hypothetical protein
LRFKERRLFGGLQNIDQNRGVSAQKNIQREGKFANQHPIRRKLCRSIPRGMPDRVFGRRFASHFDRISRAGFGVENGPSPTVARLFWVSRSRPEKKAATPPVFQNWLYLLKHPFSYLSRVRNRRFLPGHLTEGKCGSRRPALSCLLFFEAVFQVMWAAGKCGPQRHNVC